MQNDVIDIKNQSIFDWLFDLNQLSYLPIAFLSLVLQEHNVLFYSLPTIIL